MKYIISLLSVVAFILLPIIPVTTTISQVIQVPEEYTVTETYTEYVPRIGETATRHYSGYWITEQYTYLKPVTKERQITKIRLVDTTTITTQTDRISIIEWLQK